MIKVRRIGHATFETPDIDRQVDHYTQVVGLTVAAREKDRVFLATKTGQLVLQFERAAAPRIAKIAFEVSQSDDFASLAKSLSDEGIKSEQRSDAVPGTPKVLAFEDIKGTTIELFSEWAFLGRDLPVLGVGPLKLGHLAMAVPDPQAVTDFYCRRAGIPRLGLGRRLLRLPALRPGPSHGQFRARQLGQISPHRVRAEGFLAVQGACEWLGRKKVDIIWGPGRHGAGHNVFIYHRNPDDQVVEFYTELDKMLDEELGYFDPKPWHVDQPQRPKVWDRKSAGLVWGPPPTPDFLRGRDAPAPV